MDTTTYLFFFCLLFSVGSAYAQQPDIQFERAVPNLSFTRPVDLEHHGTDRTYIVQQTGEIVTFINDPAATNTDVFLDVSERVVDHQEYGEAGLLSLAFHPEYEENGYFYIYYVTDGEMTTGEDTLHSVLARFERSEDDPTEALVSSEQVVLEIPQPTARHNGGGLAFGPDGYLFLSLGEGSRGGDAYDHAQNRQTLPGNVLRIDVDNPSGERNYGIPPENPYAGNDQGYREEIYAYGFRNPWRLSIDPETGDIWVGDVGEETVEEVDRVTKGGNYGWPIMEGNRCFRSDDCSEEGLILPEAVYGHPDDQGASVTGGGVYRGDAIPDLKGTYVFGDWVSADLYFLEPADSDRTLTKFDPTEEQRIDLKHFSSFGTDKNRELYYLSLFHGSVHRLAPAEPGSTPGDTTQTPTVTENTFELSGPNPVSGGTSVTFEVVETGPVHVALYDILGREVAVLHDRVVSGGTVRRLEIPAERLSSGTYFCRMRGNGFARTQKIMLLP
jgi:glucose/arabinose dehydrogenase